MAEPALATFPGRATLRRLAVRDFRNLRRVELEPPHEGLAVVGDNGHGKTNLLEAIYYLQLQRSFRGARDAELVHFDAPAFHLSAEVEGGSARRVSVGFDRATGRKKVVLDGREMARLSDAIGALPSVIFSPADTALVAGGPGERRRYLDVILSLTVPGYLAALQRYRSALASRNAALRQGAPDAEGRVAVWEPALAEHGAVLWRERARWVGQFGERFTALCAAIGERGTAEMRLASAMTDESPAEAQLLAALERRRRVDLLRGATHSGPHRDDLALTLGDRELRTYGSAGQQRTAAIALRFLEAATLRVALGAEPLVLLDDPFSELDVGRAGRILELLVAEGVGQTVLVVPRESDIPAELTRLERRVMRAGALS